MSIFIMSQVWKLADLDGSSLLLMLAIADMANDDGLCWPGIKHLANKVRLKERQTINLINELEEKGYLTRKRRQSTSNVYQIEMGAISRMCNVVHPTYAEDCTPDMQPIAVKSSVNPNNEKEEEKKESAPKRTLSKPKKPKPSLEEIEINLKSKELLTTFIETSDIKPVSPNEWGKSMVMAKFLLAHRVTPEDIKAAYSHERQYGKNPISWIGSIKARAISQHREQ